ncbi:MAG TPA: isoprenylcysteine carboxylmethyltransferase family protein, partial [Flavihumibacter sp.]
RIGIDEAHKTRLVTEGLFSISRNPIFLGMILTTLGIFLLIPNAITLLVAVMTYFVIQIQIRLEEEYLLKQHGELYARYKNSVGRLL